MTLRVLLLSITVLLTLACGGYDPTLTDSDEPNHFGLEDAMPKKRVKILAQPDQFERRAFELAAQGKLATPQAVPDQYSKPGPWSGNNQLGNQGFLIPDPLGGVINPRTIQEVFKMNEWGFPQLWTLCLQITYHGNSNAQGQLIRAEIEFGSGGTTQTIVVDWINGTILTLPMNAVSVRAIFNNGFFGPDNVQVSVICVRGPRAMDAGGMSPINTLFEDGLVINNTESTASFPLPRFTKRVKIFSRLTSSAADFTNFYNAANVVRIREQAGGTVVTSLRFSDFLTIYGGALEVSGAGSHFIDFTVNSGALVFLTAHAELPF